jgi:hypothetical protein
VTLDLRKSRQERAARNQSLFRDVNERLEQVMQELPTAQDFLCECADPECNEMVSLSLNEYERVREEPTHFTIVPGHDLADVERVVEHIGHGRYAVVEKIEKAAELARQLDPRRLTRAPASSAAKPSR